MFSRKFLFLGMATIFWSSIAFANNNLDHLKHYNVTQALPAFNHKLTTDTSFFSFFQNNPTTLEQVLRNTSLQQQILDGKVSLQSLITTDAKTLTKPDAGFTHNTLSDLDATKLNKQNQASVDSAKDLEADAAKELDDAANDRLKPLTPIVATKPQTPRPNETRIDLNNVPTDTSLDAKGWPKYLNVPSHCPAPQSGKNYIHEFQHGENQGTGVDFGPSPPSNSFWGKLGFISYYFSPLYKSWYSLNSTDKEIFAVPFYTGYPNGDIVDSSIFGVSGSNLQISLEMPGQYPGRHTLTVSECPDDFSSAGEASIGTGLSVYVTPQEDIAATKLVHGKFLTPGKRYFLNMKGAGDCTTSATANEAQQAQENPDQPIVRWQRRAGEAVCANVATGRYDIPYAPYTGQCRQTGPYPLGYNSFTCQENLLRQSCDNADSVRYRCFDAKGQDPEMRYEQKCVGGHMTWSIGGNKPAYQNYICVEHRVGGNSNPTYAQMHDWDAMPVHRVCAKHSEGFTRTYVVMQENPARQMAKSTDTCQFDISKGYFYWKNTQRDTTFDTQVGRSSWRPYSHDNKTHTTTYYNADGVVIEQKVD